MTENNSNTKVWLQSRRLVDVKFKKLHPDAQLPKQAHEGDAGFDLFANEDVLLERRKISSRLKGRVLVDCGFAMALPEGWEAQIRPRSGIATKHGITVLNSPGTVDAGYRGPVKVALVNLGLDDVQIRKGDRIAQMVIAPVPVVTFTEVDELPSSERGEGGFGSSGK